MSRRTRSDPGAQIARPALPNAPRAIAVEATAGGTPVTVEGERVDAVTEAWLVEDGWWTEQPIRRAYWSLVTAAGRNLVLFHNLADGGWFAQAA